MSDPNPKKKIGKKRETVPTYLSLMKVDFHPSPDVSFVLSCIINNNNVNFI